ncbi:CLUMA_CG016971, isoform A [Clunio marinus]|uniref:CLUMA_CG016971, isoform A n=1 Tax=Clunio marinus TaxID=568069 RepID=A0A1J1IS12_9DIPT|nr:CLUMA_CG016971, isoform A [Clunio marinus]
MKSEIDSLCCESISSFHNAKDGDLTFEKTQGTQSWAIQEFFGSPIQLSDPKFQNWIADPDRRGPVFFLTNEYNLVFSNKENDQKIVLIKEKTEINNSITEII